MISAAMTRPHLETAGNARLNGSRSSAMLGPTLEHIQTSMPDLAMPYPSVLIKRVHSIRRRDIHEEDEMTLIVDADLF